MIRYEICKVLKNKKSLIFLATIIVVQIIVFGIAQQGTAPYVYRKYRIPFEQEMKKIAYTSPEEGIERITKFQDMAADFQFHHALAMKIDTKEDVEEYHNFLVNKYGEETLKEVEKQNKKMTIDQSCAYAYYAGKWIEQLKYQQEYSAFRKSITQGNKNTVSLFQKDQSFAERNEKKTKAAYSKLGEISFSVGNQFLLKKYYNHSFSGIFMVGAVLVMVMAIIRPDQDKKMMPFLKTQKNGRRTLMRAKLITTGILISIFIVVMEIVSLFEVYYIYGNIDLYMPIQSIDNYRNCCMAWNLLQFTFVGILMKCITGTVIGVLCIGLLLLFQKNWYFYLCFFAFLGTEWWLYENTLPSGRFAILKYANLIQGILSFTLYGHYENCNCFGYPINKLVLYFGMLLIVASLGILLCCIFWNCQREEITTKRKKKPLHKIENISLFGSVNQIYVLHEKKFLFCIMMLIYGGYCAFFQGVTTMPTTLTQVGYHQWIENYHDELTKQKEKEILEHKNKYDMVWERIAELSNNNDLNKNELAELAALNSQTGIPYDSFCEFFEQYEYVKQRKDAGKNAFLMDEYSWKRLYDGYAKENKNMGFACLCCILLCASLFEDKQNMKTLLNTTKNGRKRLWRYKYILGIIFAIISWICCILPEFVRFIRTKPIGNWSAPIGNLQLFQNCTVELPIIIVIIEIYVAQLFLCMICALVTMYLVDKTNNSFLSAILVGLVDVIILTILYHKKMSVLSTWLPAFNNPLLPGIILCAICVIAGSIIVATWELELRKDES